MTQNGLAHFLLRYHRDTSGLIPGKAGAIHRQVETPDDTGILGKIPAIDRQVVKSDDTGK